MNRDQLYIQLALLLAPYMLKWVDKIIEDAGGNIQAVDWAAIIPRAAEQIEADVKAQLGK